MTLKNRVSLITGAAEIPMGRLEIRGILPAGWHTLLQKRQPILPAR